MIGAITDQLREALQGRGVPYEVVDGPERMRQTSLARSHIAVMRDPRGVDQYGDPLTHKSNPKRIAHVDQTVLVRIYCASTKAGARTRDHQDSALAVRDQIVVSLREIVVARANKFSIDTGRWLTPDELAQQGLESWAGVVYELSCTVGAAIYDSNYKGEAAAESTIGGAHGTGFATTLDTSDSPEISDEVPGATTRIDP